MIKILKASFLLTLFLLFFSCSDNLARGGATSETTSGNISLSVYIPDSSEPLEGVEVWVYKTGEESIPAAPYGYTDSAGKLEIHYSLDKDQELYLNFISTEGALRLKPELAPSENTIQNLSVSLENYGSVFGKVILDSGDSMDDVEVILEASGERVRPDSAGNFQFDSLPPGPWTLILNKWKVRDALSFELKSGENLNIGSLNGEDKTFTDTEILRAVIENAASLELSPTDIATYRDNRVIKLELGNQLVPLDSITGSGLPWLGELTELEYVDLSQNNLPEVSSFWGWSWDSLKHLNLSQNNISEIPISFRELTQLSYLNLSQNQLSSLPPDITSLTPDTLITEGNFLNEETNSTVINWLDDYAEENWRELNEE
jgi:hypothetical protein